MSRGLRKGVCAGVFNKDGSEEGRGEGGRRGRGEKGARRG